MKKYLPIAAAAVAMATPAHADCQESLDKIYEVYEVYENANLESEQIDKINDMLEEAELNQSNGNEVACEKIAQKVAALL